MLRMEAVSKTFTAARHYRPQFDLVELKSLRVSVVPKGIAITGLMRSANQHDVSVDVAVQKKVTPLLKSPYSIRYPTWSGTKTFELEAERLRKQEVREKIEKVLSDLAKRPLQARLCAVLNRDRRLRDRNSTVCVAVKFIPFKPKLKLVRSLVKSLDFGLLCHASYFAPESLAYFPMRNE